MRLIDADALIELIDDDIASLNKDMSREGYDVCLCTLKMVKQYINALPTVELKPIVIDGEEYLTGGDYNAYLKGYKDGKAEPVKHGRWTDGKCSQCGGDAPFWAMASTYYRSRYCPHCGARMESAEE